MTPSSPLKGGYLHWDPTINIGNLITIALALIAIVFAWRDMDWRIRNLETWRREQIAGLVARAQLDEKFQTVVAEFKIAIAGLNVTVAAMDKEYERRMFGVK